MKLRILLFLLMVGAVQVVSAQKIDFKVISDETIAEKGANLSIDADKTILEPNETARLVVKIAVYPKPPEGEDVLPLTTIPDVKNLDPNNPLYTATNWKIVQGGGNLIGIDSMTQSYTAPAKIPPSKTALISVDLIPKQPRLPKVVLLQTINFEENDNVFVLNLPAMGYVNKNFTLKLNNGTQIPTAQTIDPRVANKISPAVKKQMEEAQKRMERESIADMNLQALSSNGFARWDSEQGFTSITMRGLSEINALAFNYNGNDKGTFDIGVQENKTGLGFFIGQLGFGCGDSGPAELKGECFGKVTITDLDAKFVKGTVRATVYSSPPFSKKIYSGSFYGKFKVNRAK